MQYNTILGFNNVVNSTQSGSNFHLSNTHILGQALIVSGSNTSTTGGGSVFVGRFNATGSNLEGSEEVVFAVGTGTGNASRRTGFSIDSGSNVYITGSVNLTGSLNVQGTNILQFAGSTGGQIYQSSLAHLQIIPKSGNKVQIGGNTEITGSLISSGSFKVIGDSSLTGSVNITGSLNVANAGDLTMYGHTMFNVGTFYDTTTQSGSANVSQSISYNTTDITKGVSVVSNTRLTVANAGTYNIQFSAQIDRVAGSGTDTVHIWLKKNGSNVVGSAGAITISGGAAAAKTISSWNYVVDSAANDYYELVWQPTDTNIQLIAAAASGNIPSIPSIITTVTQVR
jgi:NF-X1-type zinc finger protein NFXL1